MNLSYTMSVLTLVIGISANSAHAGTIGINAFGPGARLVGYNGLGLHFQNSAPLTIAGDLYTTNDNDVRYAASFGAFLGTTGEGIGNNTNFGFIDIELATPVLRAGAVFGQGFAPWSASVSFFDQSNALLGTVFLGNSAIQGEFAGWEADAGLIARIRATDTSSGSVLLMDDLVTEEVNSVPEPASLALFGAGAVTMTGLGWCQRRRRKM